MTTISKETIDNLTMSLNQLSVATKQAVKLRLEAIEYSGITDLRIKVIEVLEPYLGAATDRAASYAASFYDTLRYESTGEHFAALAQSSREPKATEGAVRALLSSVVISGETAAFFAAVLARIDYEIKKAAGQCVIQNALKDTRRAMFARVPTGAETCDFCIMLASRGFVYHSKKTAGEFDHYHANCDCRVVPGFDGETKVEGYDPDALYEKYAEKRNEGKPAFQK